MDKLKGHWSKITILDPDTGEAYNKFFYKRKPAYRVVIDTPKARNLAGYTLIEKDLRSAVIWLKHIKELLKDDPNFVSPKGHVKATHDRERFNIVKGLFVAALTFYGKCFTVCEGRGVKLEKSNIGEKFRDKHSDAMEYRHNFAAHSGGKRIEQARVVIALDKRRKAPPYFGRELIQPDTFSMGDLNEFIELFEHVKEVADRKIDILSEKVHEEVFSKGAEFWYKKT